jgi:hypothetical protein
MSQRRYVGATAVPGDHWIPPPSRLAWKRSPICAAFRSGMSHGEKLELWRRWKAGESPSDISRALAKNPGSVHGVLFLERRNFPTIAEALASGSE